MKKTTYWLYAAIILFLTCTGCIEGEEVGPELMADEVRLAVSGTWKIQRIESQLCRDRNCTSENYDGKSSDYFEFRADSAFLVRTDAYDKPYRSAYKVHYIYPGAVVLSTNTWMGRFEVKEAKSTMLVLVNSFTGLDPNAVFTDSYFLYR